MAMMDRIKGMLLAPRAEWPKVAAEPATVQSIYTGWIMLLGLIGPVIALALMASAPAVGITFAVGEYVNTLVGVAIAALIADVIAPSFGGTRDYVASLKLVAYAATAAWIASIALIIPILGPLVMLAGAIYSVYLLYLGVPGYLGLAAASWLHVAPTWLEVFAAAWGPVAGVVVAILFIREWRAAILLKP